MKGLNLQYCKDEPKPIVVDDDSNPIDPEHDNLG